MAKSYLKVLFIIMISTLLISCGGKQVKTDEPLIKPYELNVNQYEPCLLYTSPSPRDRS